MKKKTDVNDLTTQKLELIIDELPDDFDKTKDIRAKLIEWSNTFEEHKRQANDIKGKIESGTIQLTPQQLKTIGRQIINDHDTFQDAIKDYLKTIDEVTENYDSEIKSAQDKLNRNPFIQGHLTNCTCYADKRGRLDILSTLIDDLLNRQSTLRNEINGHRDHLLTLGITAFVYAGISLLPLLIPPLLLFAPFTWFIIISLIILLLEIIGTIIIITYKTDQITGIKVSRSKLILDYYRYQTIPHCIAEADYEKIINGGKTVDGSLQEFRNDMANQVYSDLEKIPKPERKTRTQKIRA